MMRDVLLAVRADEATHRQYVIKYFLLVMSLLILLESTIN